MKIIHLTYLQSRIFRVFCIVLSILIELTNFLLTPFTWLKGKAHFVLFIVSIVIAGYLHHFTETEQAILKSLGGFVAIVIVIALIKLLRKKLERLRIRLIPHMSALPPMYIILRKPRNPLKKLLYKLKGL